MSNDVSVVEALSLLSPFDVDRKKERLGPKRDGGYVFIPELFDKQTVFSYGIDGEYQLDVSLAEAGHKIMMFDHTIEGISNPTNNPNLQFVKEGVAGVQDKGALLNSIENHLALYGGDETDIIMKMDVEGYEHESFDALPEESLRRFQQIVFEVHSLHELGNPDFRRRFVRVFSKLNKYFTLFHVHANNYDGQNSYGFISGLPVSNLLELSYVRSDLVEKRLSRTLYPTRLDYPNVHPHDKKLWFFPFLPTEVTASSFADADRRMEEVAAGKR